MGGGESSFFQVRRQYKFPTFDSKAPLYKNNEL